MMLYFLAASRGGNSVLLGSPPFVNIPGGTKSQVSGLPLRPKSLLNPCFLVLPEVS